MSGKLSAASLASIKLDLAFQSKQLSSASGFFWKYGERLFLVTNWHVMSGRNALDNKCLDPNLALPDRLSAGVIQSAGGKLVTGSVQFEWKLGERTPWLIHPTYQSAVDVAMLDVSAVPLTGVLHFNENQDNTYMLMSGDDAFLLGYPLGLGVNKTPLWKRGTVASEPMMDVDGLPKFLVDTASTSGMSGSAVITKKTFGLLQNGQRSMGQHVTTLEGVYSGRVLEAGDLSAQIGIVWKASVLKEIADGGVYYTAD
ncbi:serine protease [Pseudophaeobacter sp. 1A09344]|uniref:S1 family peptidase n=1 Tax=Pseudophaeobacter sp. 1A09344 TaxID=3098144 RepID=UPI0034D604BD